MNSTANRGGTAYPRSRCVCFTGHRPDRLPQNIPRSMLRSMLYTEICDAVDTGYFVFHSGISPGIDLLAAEIIAEMKRENPSLRLICVSPYPAFCSGHYHNAEQPLLKRILADADETVSVSDHYHLGCFRLRNQYMVDHSARLIGIIAENDSGTGQTVRMAEAQGLELRVLTLCGSNSQET